MPYEAKPRAEIEAMMQGITKMNLKAIYDAKDAKQAEGEKFCSNDGCEIPV